MAHPLELSIARIYNKNGAILGAAFLAGDRHLLTCAHVIRAAGMSVGQTELPSETVRLDFPLLPQEKTCFAKVCFWDEARDIAGLELTGDPPLGASAVRLLKAEDVWEHKFRTFGFPQNYDDGVWASGQLKSRTGGNVIQFEDVKETGYPVQPGFSGAPVWDETLGGVIGMVSSSDTDKKARVAFCIPYDVLSVWDQIANKASTPRQSARLFLCYKRFADPDQRIVDTLAGQLSQQGHTVFVDTTMRSGENWLERISDEIRQSDFLVVLLSHASANSEMVQSEIRRAYDLRKRYGHPQILPIRIAYQDLLPYSIDAFLNPLQYILWENDADTPRVLQELTQAIQGNLPVKAPVEFGATILFSEDGRVVRNGKEAAPLPEFDPRLLDELEAPGGAVKLRDQLYVEREADARFKNQVLRAGATVTIRAARQTGKSSLLVRGIQHAKQAGTRIVHLDMQRVDQDHLASIEHFTRYLAEYIVLKLNLNADEIDKHWRKGLSPQENLSNFLEDYALEKSDATILLAMDEIDRLLQTSFYGEFFALLRSWHNNRAADERWDKLNIAMVISTEPYLLIPDMTQSPFNVGLTLYLEDFNADQVGSLNTRHGSPVTKANFPRFMELFGGHPYLTRKALYTLVTEKLSWNQLEKTAADDHGPFGDHLRRFHWLIRDDEKLKEALRRVVKSRQCPEDMLYRLLRAGLVQASGNVCKCRCELYRIYFENKL
jgi:hypothetical protein